MAREKKLSIRLAATGGEQLRREFGKLGKEGGQAFHKIGHVVKDDEDFSSGIDEAQAEGLLRQDAMIAERAVLRLINVPLTDGLTASSMRWHPSTYNLGGGALQRSTLRRKINREEHSEVPRTIHALGLGGGRKFKGLFRRRASEAGLYSHDLTSAIYYEKFY